MDSRKYDAILTASECGSISAAAQKIGCTQSALSRMIARLEKELGITLLVREHGSTRLSDYGKMLEPAISDLLQAEKTLISEINDVRKKRNDCIRIVSCSDLATNYLPKVISSFLELHQGVDLELQQSDDPKLMNQLLCTRQVDFAFCTQPLAECEWESLGKSQLFAIFPQEEQDKTLSEQLSNKKIMLPVTVNSERIMQSLKGCHVSLQASTTSLNYPMIVQLVEHHLAVSVLPGLCMRGENSNIDFLPIDPSLYQEYGVATSKGYEQSEVSREFLSFATQKLSEQIA